jgi:hypothetical protein
MYKTLIWDRTRHIQRLRHKPREYFPAALAAFEDLAASNVLELLAKAPDPARARRPTRAQVSAALKRARRRGIADKTDQILAALRSAQLGQPEAVTATYAATARSLIAVSTTLNKQVKVLQRQMEAHFGRHPDAEIYRSSPAWVPSLAPGARRIRRRPHRYADGKARKNYAATSPITWLQARRRSPPARFIHNGRLIDALMAQAFDALNASPGARACYDELRAKGTEHNDALRRLANRLVGILHGCLKIPTLNDEATAWSYRESSLAA